MAASEDAPVELSLAEKEAAYEKFVWDNLKRNYIGNYLHGMLGMTMSAGTAEIVADLASNRASHIDIAAFDPARFA